MMDVLEQQNQKLKEQLNELKSKYESLESENKILKQELSADKIINRYSTEFRDDIEYKQEFAADKKINRYSTEFWDDIKSKIRKKDTDSIKALIKNKTLTVNDINSNGDTLLHLAAHGANYEIAQLCINLGADLKYKNKEGKSPMRRAIGGNASNIQQLLLFSEMKANIGERIKDISTCINKQNGVIDNILNELSLIGDQSKQLFLKILSEIMINIIQKKLVFSDDLLNLCWKISIIDNKNNNPLESELWQTMKKTFESVIKGRNKRDWFWLKHCVIPSTIWYKEHIDIEEERKEKEKISDVEEKNENKTVSYLYYALLKSVENESKHQLVVLQNNMEKQQNKDKDSWTQLIKYDMATSASVPRQASIPRQDIIPRAIIAEYPRHQLLYEAVNISFDAVSFYDHHQYISKLLLLAQMVDDEFQQSIVKIFNIDKHSNIGKMNAAADDIITIHYAQGPVKALTRARAKAEQDYCHEKYPTAACVLDWNRCTLTFRRIKSLLFALEVFVNKVSQNQSGSIIDIVRVKNGWKEYVVNPQYADIKINVIIRGQRHNIIGEVQFMLDTMSTYKKVAHNLYAISREEYFITNSASKILPNLLNLKEERKVLAGADDVKGLLQLMVFNNNTKYELLTIDKDRNQTILTTICESGNLKALQFVLSLLDDEEQVKYLFLTDLYNQTPINNVLHKDHTPLIQYLFSLKVIRDKYNPNNDDQESRKAIYRFVFYVFAYGTESWLLLDNLGITKQHMIKILHYKYPKPKQAPTSGAWQYHIYNIILRVIEESNLDQLKRVSCRIGEDEIVQNVMKSDGRNINGLEYAILYKKLDIIKYLLSLEYIKSAYDINNTDENALKLIYRLLFWLFVQCDNDEITDYVLTKLNIDNETIMKSLHYKYPKPKQPLASDALQYHHYNAIMKEKTQDRLKKVANSLDEKK